MVTFSNPVPGISTVPPWGIRKTSWFFQSMTAAKTSSKLMLSTHAWMACSSPAISWAFFIGPPRSTHRFIRYAATAALFISFPSSDISSRTSSGIV